MPNERQPWTTPQQVINACSQPIDLRIQKVRDYGSPNNFTEQPDKPFIEYDIVYEDQIFPVTPFIIEEWITRPERNAQEIDEVLESWLQETQLSLEDPESSPYAKKYGIERQLPEPVLRLLSYVDIAGEYNQLTHRYESAQVRLSEQFQQEQAEMRARHKEELSVKMKGGRRKQLLQRQQVELSTAQKAFNSTIGPYESKKREAEVIGDLIKRKFVTDFFSPHPDEQGTLLVQQLPSIMAQLQQSTTSESSAPAYTQDHFFDEVTSFLQATKDQSLLLSYNYKPGDELSGKVEDFAVLHALYDWIFSPEVHFDDPKEQDKVMNLGKAMISFMKRGAIAKSSRINNGTSTYPILSLMYDMYNGIVARGGVSSYSEFANFFNAEFAHVSNLPQTSKESKALRDNHFGRAKRLIEDGSIPVPRIRTRPRKEGLEVYDDVVDYLLSKEYRLFDGFIALTPDIYRSAGLLENRRVLTQIRNQMKGHRVRFNEEEYQKYMTFMQKDAYDIIITHNLYRDQGIDINIGHNIDRELSLSEPEDSLVREYKTDLKHKLDDVARTGKKIQGDRGKTQYQMQEELQRYYLQKFFLGDFLGADKELIERIEKENKFLWDGFLDRQMWFVSPRGDKFEAKRDGGLQQRGISYLKYNFDKEYPREHNVEVQLEGVDNPLHFWLTADRRLLDSERRLISVDSLVQQGFMNTLLTRLFFITSGMLGEEQSEFPVKGIDSLDLIYRRAHYRTLTSTELRTITMQSPGAIRHAQEIWDEYRINLDQEEKRRWDLGTLPRDKRLTFVRSTEPEIKSRDIIPNTILFDPGKITIPIYEWERVSQERRT